MILPPWRKWCIRRYRRLLDEKQALPQLIVVDGGKGQLSAALKSLDKLNLGAKLPLLVLQRNWKKSIFPVIRFLSTLIRIQNPLKLIQNLRNEAHRFGITFHRLKAIGTMTQSALEDIPGIGTKIH